jgi:hypothetical protein
MHSVLITVEYFLDNIKMCILSRGIWILKWVEFNVSTMAYQGRNLRLGTKIFLTKNRWNN